MSTVKIGVFDLNMLPDEYFLSSDANRVSRKKKIYYEILSNDLQLARHHIDATGITKMFVKLRFTGFNLIAFRDTFMYKCENCNAYGKVINYYGSVLYLMNLPLSKRKTAKCAYCSDVKKLEKTKYRDAQILLPTTEHNCGFILAKQGCGTFTYRKKSVNGSPRSYGYARLVMTTALATIYKA